MPTPATFLILKTDNIGYPAAEEDHSFLQSCFVDSGDLAVLRDTRTPKRIVVGRTGSGKTALLMKFEETQEHVIWLNPESLSLTYLANHTLFGFFESLGINLDLFYKLLWRHIFAVEFIKSRYNLTSPESAKQSFFERIVNIFGPGQDKKEAVEYLTHWGETIWQDTEHRVKEITTKFVSTLQSKLGANIALAKVLTDASCTVTEEQKAEIVKHGQEVVNHIQIRHLNRVIELLAENVFTDPQQPYYLLVDKLDEDWIEDPIRYKLIRAMIETVREFQKIQNCKIIVALRQDLIERVLTFASEHGTQREKLDQLCLALHWTPAQLVDILDRRVAQMVRHRYTGQTVHHTDLLPPRVGNTNITDYIIQRTLYRPRDVIHFFNCCLDRATGQPAIRAELFTAAEADYSRQRLQYLANEWHTDFPGLDRFALAFLSRRPPSFKLADIDDTFVADTCLQFAASFQTTGLLYSGALSVAEGNCPPAHFRNNLFLTFYKVGLIGLKLATTDPVAWSFRNQINAPNASLDASTAVSICPAFYRVLQTALQP